MSDSIITRISSNAPMREPQDFEAPPPASVNKTKPEESARAFLDLIIDNTRDIPATRRVYTEAQHREARRRVFEEAVNHILLEDKHHPYHSFAQTQEGQAMREAIIEVLVESSLPT